MKSPLGLALLHYLDAFDPDIAYSLREINPTTLEEMIWNSVSVEANLLIKKSKLKNERKVTLKEEPSTSFNTIFDAFLRNMESMVDKMSILDRKTEPQIRNTNFWGQQQQPQFQIKQRE